MMRIFLIGFMGSGKSTLGRMLAEQLGVKFIDLDEWIESTAGMKIRDIFTRKGETFFRKLEAVRLREVIASEENMVLACGGGTPCYFDNISFINNAGISIWLNTAKEVMADRLLAEAAERPLVSSLPKEKLHEFIEDKLEQRLAYYGQAKIIIDPAHMSVEALVAQLKEHV